MKSEIELYLNKYRKMIAIVLFIFLLIFALAYAYKHHGLKKMKFSYPVIGKEKIVKEIRYLPSKPSQGLLKLYIEELVLGPGLQRTRPLFSLGTTVEFCFLRDQTLYLGLSKHALFEESDSAGLYEGIDFLEKNIKQNFRKVKNLRLFIGGIYIDEKLE